MEAFCLIAGVGVNQEVNLATLTANATSTTGPTEAACAFWCLPSGGRKGLGRLSRPKARGVLSRELSLNRRHPGPLGHFQGADTDVFNKNKEV